MRLWLDPDRIADVGLTSSEVLAAIRAPERADRGRTDRGAADCRSRIPAEPRYTEFVEDGDVPSRYGLRKSYNNEFDRDPERYVLRVGYPDFPECPFGESVSVLGFDTAKQTYVWLVTSILRDPRLN
jgi:hypothetical protein